MKLSVETLQSILSFLGSPDSPAEGDRRKRQRMDVTGYAKIALTSPDGNRPDEFVNVVLKDISAEGIGILHTQAIPAGARFILHLPSAAGPGRSILCTVARCRAEGEKMFAIGAKFSQEIISKSAAA